MKADTVQTSAPDPRLAERGQRAVTVLGLFNPHVTDLADLGEDDLVFSGHPFGHFEHLVHELAHAVLLGIDPSEQTANDIGAALDAVPGIVAVMNETMTFVVEAHVLQHYGILIDDDRWAEDSRYVTFNDLWASAEVQGCDTVICEHLYKSRAMFAVAMTVVHWIDRSGFPEVMLEDR